MTHEAWTGQMAGVEREKLVSRSAKSEITLFLRPSLRAGWSKTR